MISRMARVTLSLSALRWPVPGRLRRKGRPGEAGAAAGGRDAPHRDPHLLQGSRGRAAEGSGGAQPRSGRGGVRDGPDEAGRAARRLRRPARRRHPRGAVRLGRDCRASRRPREAAGIPVFTVDIAAHGGKVVSHIASDNTQGGRLAAQTLAGLLHDKGTVIVIDHPEVASVQDRTRGFDEEMGKHPGITVVGRPSASGQRARAMAVMEDMLQAHRDLNGVFAINDDSALGALSVLDAAGRTDVVIVGFDATLEAQDAIRKGGALKADIMQYPTRLGTTAIDIIAKHLAGQPVPASVPVEVNVVTAATLAAAACRRPVTHLTAARLTKSYGAVRVLHGVDLDLAGGEIHALVGENGAGKSTHHQDPQRRGRAGRRGSPPRRRPRAAGGSAGGARSAGSAPSTRSSPWSADLSVVDNVFLGRERGRFLLRTAAMRRDVQALLDGLGVHIDPSAPAGSLSVAHQQMVEIARALSTDARVLDPRRAVRDAVGRRGRGPVRRAPPAARAGPGDPLRLAPPRRDLRARRSRHRPQGRAAGGNGADRVVDATDPDPRDGGKGRRGRVSVAFAVAGARRAGARSLCLPAAVQRRVVRRACGRNRGAGRSRRCRPHVGGARRGRSARPRRRRRHDAGRRPAGAVRDPRRRHRRRRDLRHRRPQAARDVPPDGHRREHDDDLPRALCARAACCRWPASSGGGRRGDALRGRPTPPSRTVRYRASIRPGRLQADHGDGRAPGPLDRGQHDLQ